MRVLLVEPGKHPRVMEVGDTLDEMYRILECDTITATYPWEDYVGLVCDDEGLFRDKPWNRVIDQYTTIKGNFFICGLSDDDFADLPDDLIEKYKEKFWIPEFFIPTPNGLMVIRMDDGSRPN